MRRTFLISALLAGFLVAADPNSATAYDKSELIAPEGKALVVFIQNQKVDRKMMFTVFESDKRCVAEVGGREAQLLPVEPAPLILYVLGYGNTKRIEIYPETGRTYFVRLHTVDKPMGQSPEVTLVRRASEEHRLLKFRLEGAFITRTIGDDKCYGRPLDERKNRTQRRLNEANGDWKSGDDAYRDRYMLIEKDGLTAQDIALF
jgi:hypothetical protein